MDRFSWLRRGLLLVVAAPALGVVLTLGASLVPDRFILDELVESVEQREIVNIPQVGISGRGVDVFSDCIALTMGLGETEGGSATNWLRSPTLGSCDGTLDSISAFRVGEGLTGGYEYFRYWHGYTTVSRPLVAALGVSGQRIVLFWAYIAAVAILAKRLWRHHGTLVTGSLLVPFLLTSDSVELARSLPHGAPALIAIIGAWAIHRVATNAPHAGRARTGEHIDGLPLATTAFVAGAGYVFVDVLTTPPGAWALATAVAVLGSMHRMSGRRLALRGAVTAAAWIAGWVWMWVSKWIIATAFLGYDEVRDNIGGAIDERLSGDTDFIDLAPFNAIRTNVDVWLEHPMSVPVLVAIAVLAAVVIRRRPETPMWSDRLILAAPAVFPILWFEVLRNHSLVHPLFVHRSLAVTAGIVAVALAVGVQDSDVDAESSGQSDDTSSLSSAG